MQTISQRESNGSRRVSLALDPVSMTEQSHKGETDINSIMKKYRKTGVLPQVASGSVYGDFATEDDFHSTQEKVIAAENLFMDLPSEVRSRFGNDPGEFLGFVNDPSNREEAVAMGLLHDPNKKVPIPIGTILDPPKADTEPKPAPDGGSG